MNSVIHSCTVLYGAEATSSVGEELVLRCRAAGELHGGAPRVTGGASWGGGGGGGAAAKAGGWSGGGEN